MGRRALLELQYRLPEGLLVDAAWLENLGISASMRSRYVRQGWLVSPAYGIYRRPGPELRWEHVVISLQTFMNFPVAVGGETALHLQGHRHYLNLRGREAVYLYSPRPLPSWVHDVPCNGRFRRFNSARFWPDASPVGHGVHGPQAWDWRDSRLPDGFVRLAWGTWDWPLVVAAEERAALEMWGMLTGKSSQEFDNPLKVCESLIPQPTAIQHWLSTCHNQKAIRLFLWMADYNQLTWRSQLDLSQIPMGTGHLHLVPRGTEGRYCAAFNLTVPRDLYWDRDDVNTAF